VRTFYRVLKERGETKERRHQRSSRQHGVPHLVATRPNEVWTWDITKLATTTSGKFLNLYLIIDLWSRYIVGWLIAEHENSALAKQLVRETVERYRMEGPVLTLHNDRGSPMTATSFMDLLGELKVNASRSRPRVSNDNPQSESINKTVKYQPDYPGRFESLSHARAWFSEFANWYNHEHCHSGLALFRPGDLFFDRIETLAHGRQATLDRAYAAHPERFVKGPPIVKRPPAQVIINPIDPGEMPTLPKASA
jgi:putative transposase